MRPAESVLQPLQARFKALGSREQTGLIVAAGVLALAGLLALGVWPALRDLRASPARHAQADAQLQTMRALQARAQTLQAAPRWDRAEGLVKLQAVMPALGNSAQLTAGNERASVTLQAARAEGLGQWLARARSEAHAVPHEARLTRDPNAVTSALVTGSAAVNPPAGTPATLPANGAGSAAWSGSLVMGLPPP